MPCGPVVFALDRGGSGAHLHMAGRRAQYEGQDGTGHHDGHQAPPAVGREEAAFRQPDCAQASLETSCTHGLAWLATAARTCMNSTLRSATVLQHCKQECMQRCWIHRLSLLLPSRRLSCATSAGRISRRNRCSMSCVGRFVRKQVRSAQAAITEGFLDLQLCTLLVQLLTVLADVLDAACAAAHGARRALLPGEHLSVPPRGREIVRGSAKVCW